MTKDRRRVKWQGRVTCFDWTPSLACSTNETWGIKGVWMHIGWAQTEFIQQMEIIIRKQASVHLVLWHILVFQTSLCGPPPPLLRSTSLQCLSCASSSRINLPTKITFSFSNTKIGRLLEKQRAETIYWMCAKEKSLTLCNCIFFFFFTILTNAGCGQYEAMRWDE